MNFKELAYQLYSQQLYLRTNSHSAKELYLLSSKTIELFEKALEEAYLAGQESKKIVAVKTEKPIEKQNNFVYDGLGNRRRPDWPF